MTVALHMVGAAARRGRNKAALLYAGRIDNVVNTDLYTFNITLGPAATDRYVFVTAGSEAGGARNWINCVIGGYALTRLVDGGGSAKPSAIWGGAVPTGTGLVTCQISGSGNMGYLSAGIYFVNGLKSLSPQYALPIVGDTPAFGPSLVVKKGGFVIACTGGNGEAGQGHVYTGIDTNFAISAPNGGSSSLSAGSREMTVDSGSYGVSITGMTARPGNSACFLSMR